MTFVPLEKILASIPKDHTFKGTLIALDPGETTGYAIFNGTLLVGSGQLVTANISGGSEVLRELIMKQTLKPTIVYESYRVYKWKAQHHINSSLHTPQLIGAIKAICSIAGYENHEQTAQMAKGFVSDNKLKGWGMWIKGQRHARDAIRHGLFFNIFTYPKIYRERNS